MTTHPRSFLAWLADTLLGPTCPLRTVTGCNHRARGPRSLDTHILTRHPGWEPTP